MRHRVSLWIALCLIFNLTCAAQNSDGYEIVKLIESTPIKDQGNSSTCWAFATTSFIETEAIRLGHKPIVLSPMLYVIPTYLAKADKYVRMHGNSDLGAGDLTFSVMDAYKQVGAIPESIYNGLNKEERFHNHRELTAMANAMVKSLVSPDMKHLKGDTWRKALSAVLDAYLGGVPQSFEYGTTTYSSKSFADKYIGINPEDYVEVTSYSHHPFYSKFQLEIPANWNNKSYLNLPIEDFRNLIISALMNGYSLGWDGDISEPAFTENIHFMKLSGRFKDEKSVTQQMRQVTFDDHTTQDDHNMHIIGIAKDAEGNNWYVCKNSWGCEDKLGGYVYMSEPYLLLKTISILVHKNALPGKAKRVVD